MFGSAKRKQNVVELDVDGSGSKSTFNFSDDMDVELAAFRQMVDSMPVNVMTLDLEDFTINYVNKTSVETLKGLEHLPLVGCSVTKIGDADLLVVFVFIGKAEPGAKRHLCANDTVAAVECALNIHVHGSTHAARYTTLAPREFGHDRFRTASTCQHVGVATVAGNNRITGLKRLLDTGDNRFLPDIEVAESADQSHSV